MDIANVRAVLAPKKELFEAQGKMLPAILKDFSELTQAQKEVLATVTSIANRCAYWISQHGQGAVHLMQDDALLEKLYHQDYGDFDEKMQEAIAYVRRLTLSPAEDFSQSRERLCRVGWSDGAILEINVVCAYFNMMNRIAQGLNVSLDESTDYAEYMYGEDGRMQSGQSG